MAVSGNVPVVTTRLYCVGRDGSLCIRIPRAEMRRLGWRREDIVALRLYGTKLVAERVPLEPLAIMPNKK